MNDSLDILDAKELFTFYDIDRDRMALSAAFCFYVAKENFPGCEP